jgi:hypothetical protein
MVKDLKKIADLLDNGGFFKEADLLDNILVKVSQDASVSDDEGSDDDYISALTLVIERVSRLPESFDKEERLKVLNTLLEEMF